MFSWTHNQSIKIWFFVEWLRSDTPFGPGQPRDAHQDAYPLGPRLTCGPRLAMDHSPDARLDGHIWLEAMPNRRKCGQKRPSLSGGLTARNATGSLLHPSGQPTEWIGCAPGHATSWPSSNHLASSVTSYTGDCFQLQENKTLKLDCLQCRVRKNCKGKRKGGDSAY